MRTSTQLKLTCAAVQRELGRIGQANSVLELELTMAEALFLWRHCRLIAGMRFLDQDERRLAVDIQAAVTRLLQPYPAIAHMLSELVRETSAGGDGHAES